MSIGAKNNFYCEECQFTDNDGGDCPRCGGWMHDVSGKEYIMPVGDVDQEEMDMRDDFDLSDFSEDEFEAV